MTVAALQRHAHQDPYTTLPDSTGLDLTRVAGFPVIQARSSYPSEGYGAYLGWIQVIDYLVPGEAEPVWVAPDVAPQALDANTPYLSFGIEPTLFDAPFSDAPDLTWRARAFLTFSPDCVISRVVEPLCGFTWGFDLDNGTVTPRELTPATTGDWEAARRVLRLRLPTWTFGGDGWTPLKFV